MHALRQVLRAIDWLSLTSGRLVAWMVPIMTLALVFEVVSRYFFDAPTLWAQDTAVFLFGYIGLVGGAYVMRERAHINVDLFYARWQPRRKAAADVISTLIGLFFVALVVVYGFDETVRAHNLNQHRPTDWAPLLSPFIAAIAIGGALLWLQMLAHLVRCLYLAVTGRFLDDALKPVETDLHKAHT